MVRYRSNELDPLGLKRSATRLDVLAHQEQFGAACRLPSGQVWPWMASEFGGWQGQYKPALPCIDALEAKYFVEEPTSSLGIISIQYNVRTGDRNHAL